VATVGGRAGSSYRWCRFLGTDDNEPRGGKRCAFSAARAATGGEPDCDDTDPAISPGALEVADGKDNDCDGLVDE